MGMWGVDANNLWAVGDAGTIIRWNGTAWSALATGTLNPLYGVFCSDANNVWTVGQTGTILKRETLVR